MMKNKEKIIMAIQWALFLSVMVTAMFKQSPFLQLRWAGFLIIALSLYLLLLAYQAHAETNPVKLGSSPAPKDNTQLVISGIYSFIRHPIYLSFILVFWGLVLITGYLSSLVVAFLASIFFYFKTIYEDKHLMGMYSDFSEYIQSVGRFFPKLNR